jgi:hypothetical protein
LESLRAGRWVRCRGLGLFRDRLIEWTGCGRGLVSVRLRPWLPDRHRRPARLPSSTSGGRAEPVFGVALGAGVAPRANPAGPVSRFAPGWAGAWPPCWMRLVARFGACVVTLRSAEPGV